MSGRYAVTDLLGRCYWQTDDIEEARAEARAIVNSGTRVMLRDMQTGASTYVSTGTQLDFPLTVA